MMLKKIYFLGCSVIPLFSTVANAIPVTNAYINFAGAGGDFSSRTATFSVPDKDTTKFVRDGLRLYEVHLAKMIELTHIFCQDREKNYVIYWNYEANDGNIFMGQYTLTCQFAKETLNKFGTAATESITIHYAGNAETAKITALNLNSKNAKQFASLVQSIKPGCIETTPKICPGDRLN